MRAMAKAGDWAAISALFDAFLEVAEPSVHLRVRIHAPSPPYSSTRGQWSYD